MEVNDHSGAMRLPMQTPAAIITASAISHALGEFYRDPSPANKAAAVDALEAHLNAVERHN